MAVSWWLVGLFGLSGLACLAAAFHGSRLRNADAGHGLRWLLTLSGAWGFLQAGVLVAGEESTAVALYVLALTVGFATPFAWLYFTSAYAGRDYHRRPAYRLAGLATYVAVVSLKLTNPVHGGYFSVSFRTDPVRRLVIDEGGLYWASLALAYVLSLFGFYLLYRLFRESEPSSWTLVGLFAATGLAVVPNAVASAAPSVLPQLSYEPLGVAVFAVGTVYLVEDAFLAVERTATRSFVERTAGGVLVLGADGRLRDHNERAAELFPSLAEGASHLADVSPDVADAYREERPALVDIPDASGDARTYCVTSERLTVGGAEFGWALLVQDVTDIERQRERLERHEEQLGDMAGAIAHELRNAVAIADGYLAETADRIEEGRGGGGRVDGGGAPPRRPDRGHRRGPPHAGAARARRRRPGARAVLGGGRRRGAHRRRRRDGRHRGERSRARDADASQAGVQERARVRRVQRRDDGHRLADGRRLRDHRRRTIHRRRRRAAPLRVRERRAERRSGHVAAERPRARSAGGVVRDPRPRPRGRRQIRRSRRDREIDPGGVRRVDRGDRIGRVTDRVRRLGLRSVTSVSTPNGRFALRGESG